MKKEKKARQTAKLTKKSIDALPLVTEGKQDYWDSDLQGFMLRISPRQKTYYAVKKVSGAPVWVNIGIHGQVTPEKARAKAIENLGLMAQGINPNKTKAESNIKDTTLKEALDGLFIAKPALRKNTELTYKGLIKTHLKDWLNKPLKVITEDMIAKRHIKIAEDSGHSSANNTMRTFRLIYNFAKARLNKKLPDNPVKTLSEVGQWFDMPRRKTIIKSYDLPKWYDAVMALDNPYMKEYLLLLLLTGLREKEGLTMKWEDVDMKDKTFTIPAYRAKNNEILILPMSADIFDLFKRLKVLKLNDYVFPSLQRKEVHQSDSRRHVEAVIEKSKVQFCLHDLRRTYATMAQSIAPYIVVKLLLNHKTDKDVTAGYMSLTVEDLRPYQRSISNTIMRAALDQKGKVINFERKNKFLI
jgi:integrase